MIGSLSDAELTQKARAGDAEAFMQLCEKQRPRLWRIAASVARGADADDLAQEAIVRAFSALRSYKGAAPFEAWLCRIAVNVAHDYIRSAWKRRVLLHEGPAPETGEVDDGLEQEVHRRELQRQVRQAVAKLPERQRVPIWLHYFEGFTPAEVARLEGAPEATVRSRLRAGLQRLSRELAEQGAADVAPQLIPHGKGCGG